VLLIWIFGNISQTAIFLFIGPVSDLFESERFSGLPLKFCYNGDVDLCPFPTSILSPGYIALHRYFSELLKGCSPMGFAEQRTLGSTGLKVGRLGISSSFGAPAAAFEEAFERGCNYFTWGTFIKGRSTAMQTALHNLSTQGRRDDLVVGMLTYAHNAWLTERFLHRGLKVAGLDYADVLLLGWFPKRPPQKIIDGAVRLKEKGLVRFIGLTGHNRKLFPQLAQEGVFDLFHIRYNAVHTGAETECFPQLGGNDEKRPGIVSFTATAWGKLLQPKKMPPGEPSLSAAECYRFALSHPAVDVCMMGAKNREEMRQNLAVLDQGPLSEREMERVRRIGEHLYGKAYKQGHPNNGGAP
jgi:predicted aldo/keto reductase-like oxidoreductase